VRATRFLTGYEDSAGFKGVIQPVSNTGLRPAACYADFQPAARRREETCSAAHSRVLISISSRATGRI